MNAAQQIAILAKDPGSDALDVIQDLILEAFPNAHPRTAEWIRKADDRFLGIEFFEGFVAIYSRYSVNKWIRVEIYKAQKNAKHAVCSQTEVTLQEAKEFAATWIGEKTKVETIRVGDVYVDSWGYNMTINHFFEVIAVMGSKVVLAPCASVLVRGDAWSGIEKCGERDQLNTITVRARRGVPYVKGRMLYQTTREEEHVFNNLD